MKAIAAIGALVFVVTVNAQDLPGTVHDRPDKGDDVSIGDSQFPAKPARVQTTNDPGTAAPAGRGLSKHSWIARKVKPCGDCSGPMTFRQAAFDRKAIALWGATFALTGFEAATVTSGECVNGAAIIGGSLKCTPGSPVRYVSDRNTVLAMKVPLVTAGWLLTAWQRKGEANHPGWKKWWLVPVMLQAGSLANIGLSHH